MRYIGLVYQSRRSGKLRTRKIGWIVQKVLLAPAMVGAIAGGFFFAYQMYVILFSMMLDGLQRGLVP